MKSKAIIGWIVLAIICLAPILLWYFLGPGPSELVDYGSITHTLGELAALVGVTMFAMTFILSTRARFIEDIFGGLDKVYVVHGIIGGSALILILFHPILLVLKFIPNSIRQAAIYMLPSTHWSVNFGIIAIVLFIALIYTTLYTRIKYNKWKFSHEFLGLVFLIAIFHIFLVRNDGAADNIFAGYYLFASIVSAIGLGGFIYSLFLKNRLFKEAIYSVDSIEKKKDVYEINMVPYHKPIHYKSGQFIFVRFYNERLDLESHPFSIASKSDNPKIRIIVKSLGDFTSKLDELHVGDKVAIDGPYGRFNYEREGNYQVWVAGGIGITPFIGMAEDLKNYPDMKVDLYYSVRDKADLIGLSSLQAVAESNKNFRLFTRLSNQDGYLTVDYIFDKSGRFNDKAFFLCGPKALKESLTKKLLSIGVSLDKINVEEFDFR